MKTKCMRSVKNTMKMNFGFKRTNIIDFYFKGFKQHEEALLEL